MKRTIHDYDLDDRPREKLIKAGEASLSDAELLAILIGSGNKKKNAIELASEVLDTFSYEELSTIKVEELSKIDGIKSAKAATIVAALNFGKRVNQKIINRKLDKIRSCEDIYELMKNYFIDSTKEHFYSIMLNTKNDIIAIEHISTGDLNSSIVNPREVFTPAVKRSAKAVALVHNHPSGSCKPSREDLLITRRLVEAGLILDIKVLDHVIIGRNSYYSFRREDEI
ncbi:MAG: DNA repair protein RadC [Anaerococcus sp.]|jgi:DNA repair protein RadC|nr:DNA repair protein RadC [Peptoniphilaceae bacterium]MDY3055405.1 DNA repair protein RadC [Anaerococcus sp.]